jgi:hypothetical protein
MCWDLNWGFYPGWINELLYLTLYIAKSTRQEEPVVLLFFIGLNRIPVPIEEADLPNYFYDNINFPERLNGSFIRTKLHLTNFFKEICRKAIPLLIMSRIAIFHLQV